MGCFGEWVVGAQGSAAMGEINLLPLVHLAQSVICLPVEYVGKVMKQMGGVRISRCGCCFKEGSGQPF